MKNVTTYLFTVLAVISVFVTSTPGDDGVFAVTNIKTGDFAGWASQANVEVLTGDFNGDGFTDVALTGQSGWKTLPVAFSNGNGTFRVTNQNIVSFAGWASQANVEVLTGDFNGDGFTDVALTGQSGWKTLPVGFSLTPR